MAGKKTKGQLHRLEDLIVEEVSTVDKPANQRRFLAIKSEDGNKMATKGKEIQDDGKGNLSTEGADKPTVVVDIAKAFADAGVHLANIEKRLTISSVMRSDIFRSLQSAMGRIGTVMGTVDMAQNDRGEGASTLTPVLAKELGEVSKEIAQAAKVLSGGKVVKNDPENAVVSEIEEKIEALADAINNEVVEKRSIGTDRISKLREGVEFLAGILTDLDKDADGKTKAKKKPNPFAKPDAVAAAKLAAEQAEKEKKAKEKTKKDDSDVSELRKSVEILTGSVGKLTGVVEKQRGTISDLRKARQGSNVISVEKTDADSVEVPDEQWPMDMNDEKTKEKTEKAISFHD